MAQSSVSPEMLQQWIARQAQMKQLAAMMGGAPQAPRGIEGASQMLPGAPNIADLTATRPGLLEMMGGPQAQPQGLLDVMSGGQSAPPMTLLDAMGGSQAPQYQSLMPPPMAMLSQQAPVPAGVPSFRRKAPTPAMASPELQAQRREAKSVTVKSGDTMSAIAKRNGMTLAELKAKNPQIKNANRIFVGDKINL